MVVLSLLDCFLACANDLRSVAVNLQGSSCQGMLVKLHWEAPSMLHGRLHMMLETYPASAKTLSACASPSSSSSSSTSSSNTLPSTSAGTSISLSDELSDSSEASEGATPPDCVGDGTLLVRLCLLELRPAVQEAVSCSSIAS